MGSVRIPSFYASLLTRLRILIPENRLCILCKMGSTQLICRYCSADLKTFDLANLEGNLLNSVAILRGLKQVDFDYLTAIGDYQWPWKQLITGLKFSRKLSYGRALAEMFVTRVLPYQTPLPELIVPIPLHPARLVSRKYNQAAVLAKEISRLTSIPCAFDGLKRVHATQAQSGLSSAKRLSNIKQAFALNQTFEVKHLVLLDDVITTGATISAACKLLRQHYPHIRIDVWCMALTLERQ